MKIDRALIIRRQGVELSERYAQTCAESCEEHGLPYEFIEAVQFLKPKEAYASVGAFMKRDWSPEEGNACCHSSHIKCWKRIVEIGKPCIVLEHDALIVGDVTTVDIPDMATVTFGHRVNKKDSYVPPRPAEKLTKISHSVGVHACGLSPATAEWLIEDATVKGLTQGVDKWLMMGPGSKLPLYVCDPPQAVCWMRESTMPICSDGHHSHRGVRGAKNRHSEIVPSWYEGIRD